ncbi:DinB family protein [Spongiimicrobium salis]|uniref:DinB family protein n=1 Tax=Spongiimicrobium salis TaxID=1667022 RepID=UPI00374DBDFE
MENKIQDEIIANALYRFDESTRMIKISLALLSEEEVWQKPNGSLNSVANLLLHLCGNITQYAIASLGEKEDLRERDLEFSTTSGYTKDQLWQQLEATVSEAKNVIKAATTQQLQKKREVQGFYFSGIGILMHVVEHYSYHTGQIAFWTKLLKEKDLRFYDGMDLSIKNKE